MTTADIGSLTRSLACHRAAVSGRAIADCDVGHQAPTEWTVQVHRHLAQQRCRGCCEARYARLAVNARRVGPGRFVGMALPFSNMQPLFQTMQRRHIAFSSSFAHRTRTDTAFPVARVPVAATLDGSRGEAVMLPTSLSKKGQRSLVVAKYRWLHDRQLSDRAMGTAGMSGRVRLGGADSASLSLGPSAVDLGVGLVGDPNLAIPQRTPVQNESA